MLLVEFLTTELEIDDALELTDVERFGKGFKNRPTCTLIIANHISDFVRKQRPKLRGKKIFPIKHIRQFQARLKSLEGVFTQSWIKNHK